MICLQYESNHTPKVAGPSTCGTLNSPIHMDDRHNVVHVSVDNFVALLSTEATLAKEEGIVVAVVDALKNNSLAHVASDSKLSFTTSQFDILPYTLVIQRSLCIGESQ